MENETKQSPEDLALLKLKRCPKCRQSKPLFKFNHNKGKPDGHSSYCRECTVALGRVYRQRPEVKEQKRLCQQKYFQQEENRQHRREYYHREEIRQRQRKQERKYQKSIKGKKVYNAAKRRWMSKPKNKLNRSVYNGIYHYLKNKNKHTWDMLPYTLKELKSYLESQFVGGMCWENYGKWEIDHIIPISFFQFNSSDDVEFKMCWRLENLQPLWKSDNCRKSNQVKMSA